MGRSGEFRRAQRSSQAEALTDAWQRNWPEVEPIGYLLRGAYPDRWVRFHSLPNSKRYADDAAEYAELLARHRRVLSELQGGVGSGQLVAIAEDFEARDLASGWSRRQLPRAWPWRRALGTVEASAPSFLWVSTGLGEDELDALLIAAADDQARVIVSTAELLWLYHPYDGGADVIAADTTTRDALRDRHPEWLSAHASGL